MLELSYKYANFIINEINKRNVIRKENNEKIIVLANERLQKILFYSYVKHARHYEKQILDDIFYAWENGPILPKIYNRYNISMFGSVFPLGIIEELIEINKEMKDVIESVIDSTINIDTERLIENTRIEGSPLTIANTVGLMKMIKFEDIIRFYRIDENYNELFK